MASIREQVHRNAVALISLAIAVSSLGYNTWRNETSEAQRNVRHAAFRVIESLGYLQQSADYHYYFVQAAEESDEDKWLRGWGEVSLVRDLTMVMPPPAPDAGLALYASWSEHFSRLDDRHDNGSRTEESMAAMAAINEQIESARSAVLEVLQSLE